MTEQPQGTPPPNAAPPHVATPPPAQQQQPRPVVVQQNDPGLTAQLTEMANAILAMPEKLANAVRETASSQPQQQPTGATQGQQTAAVEQATTDTRHKNQEEAGYGRPPGKFANWWYTAGMRSKK